LREPPGEWSFLRLSRMPAALGTEILTGAAISIPAMLAVGEFEEVEVQADYADGVRAATPSRDDVRRPGAPRRASMGRGDRNVP
jgi:hypothetical protein